MATPHTTPGIAALSRVVWMLLGPMALALTAFAVIKTGRDWLTVADFAYLTILGVVLLARWAEFHSGHAETATGEPLTRDAFRRALVVTILFGLVVWIGANLVANY